MKLAIQFTNFGPYHLARLRALGNRLAESGGRLFAYEMAGSEKLYPWRVSRSDEPFSWSTLFPNQAIEDVSPAGCRSAASEALDRDQPDAVAICGYSRPESMAALRWSVRNRKPAILMSETQKLDYPRVWWKEAIKRSRLQRFSAALVGGPRHRDYLVELGMTPNRIALGYNAVDNAHYAINAEIARTAWEGRKDLPGRDYFLAVNRFVPEKNLLSLVRAFSSYRSQSDPAKAWDLVLCGGGPSELEIAGVVAETGLSAAIHRPGFLQAGELARYYAHAGGFIHPSLLEPWGLVVNEAASCGLPLLVSERAGCVETLVPDPPGTTGKRFDPSDETSMTAAMLWLADMPLEDRAAMGRRAVEVVSHWGPDRFASGMLEAIASVKTTKKRGRVLIPGGTQ